MFEYVCLFKAINSSKYSNLVWKIHHTVNLQKAVTDLDKKWRLMVQIKWT